MSPIASSSSPVISRVCAGAVLIESPWLMSFVSSVKRRNAAKYPDFAMCALRGYPLSLLQPHLLQQRLEARLRAKGIEGEIYSNIKRDSSALRIEPLKPGERLLCLS